MLHAMPPQIWAMSLPGGTHQKEIRVDLVAGMTVNDLAERARIAWGALTLHAAAGRGKAFSVV